MNRNYPLYITRLVKTPYNIGLFVVTVVLVRILGDGQELYLITRKLPSGDVSDIKQSEKNTMFLYDPGEK